MHHQRNGLYFQRLENGDVRVLKTYDEREPRPDNVVLDQTISRSEFASIVAHATPTGETSDTYYKALAFLKGE